MVGIASRDHSAALALDCGAIPPDDERVLRLAEVGDLIERLQIVRAALVALLLLFVLAGELHSLPLRRVVGHLI